MLSFTRKNGQLSFYLAHKLYKNGPKKGTVPEKINSHQTRKVVDILLSGAIIYGLQKCSKGIRSAAKDSWHRKV